MSEPHKVIESIYKINIKIATTKKHASS